MRVKRLLAVTLVLAASVVCAGAASGRAPGHPHCTAATQAVGRRSPRAPLVPGHPTAMLLCHYGPLPQRLLVGSRLVTSRARLRRITRGLNALPPMPRLPIACPSDNGARIVIYVMYRKGGARVVDLELNGCMIASRGSVLRWDAPPPDHGRLFRWLTRLAS